MTLSKNPGDEIFPKYIELFSIPNSSSKPLENPMGPYSILHGSSVNMCPISVDARKYTNSHKIVTWSLRFHMPHQTVLCYPFSELNSNGPPLP